MNNNIKSKKPKAIKDILISNDWLVSREKSEKYISQEFQDFGVRLAHKLNDVSHTSLYIKLAKNENRPILEKAISFALDYPKASSKAKVFMWKLKELKDEYKKTKKEKNLNL